jgi:hypothetical protein
MHSALSITTLLLPVFPALISAQLFKFTGPSTDKKLDFSAHVLVQWNKGKSAFPQMDLQLSVPLASDATHIYPLVVNLTLASGAGSYTVSNSPDHSLPILAIYRLPRARVLETGCCDQGTSPGARNPSWSLQCALTLFVAGGSGTPGT